jgi:transposase
MGKEVHPDIKRAAVRLSHYFSIETTATFLNISTDTVRRAITLYSETGDVVKEKTGVRRGRKPILDDSHREVSRSFSNVKTYLFLQYLKGVLSGQNDHYLDELQDLLYKSSGKFVSLPTVWRTLDSMGITNKRARSSLFMKCI